MSVLLYIVNMRGYYISDTYLFSQFSQTDRKHFERNKVMKKKIALLAMICVLAASGCNNGNNQQSATTTAAAPESTTTAAVSTDENGKNSQVVYDGTREDTTEEALAYLEKECPLFKKYLDMRRQVPLTFETTVGTEEGEYKTGLYIKDAENFAQYSKDPDGNETTVLYMKDTAYQITTADKVIYKYDCSEAEVKSMFEAQTLATIYLDDVQSTSYGYGTYEFEGTEYHKVTITPAEGPSSELYFDIDTDKLVLSVANGSVAMVDTFENTFNRDDIFILPEGYEVKSYNDYIEELQEQMKKAQESQAAEQQAAAESSASSAETTE